MVFVCVVFWVTTCSDYGGSSRGPHSGLLWLQVFAAHEGTKKENLGDALSFSGGRRPPQLSGSRVLPNSMRPVSTDSLPNISTSDYGVSLPNLSNLVTGCPSSDKSRPGRSA